MAILTVVLQLVCQHQCRASRLPVGQLSLVPGCIVELVRNRSRPLCWPQRRAALPRCTYDLEPIERAGAKKKHARSVRLGKQTLCRIFRAE